MPNDLTEFLFCPSHGLLRYVIAFMGVLPVAVCVAGGGVLQRLRRVKYSLADVLRKVGGEPIVCPDATRRQYGR